MGIFTNMFKKQPDELEQRDEARGVPREGDADTAADTPKDTKPRRLLFFFGDECPHCHRLAPRVKAVEHELGVTFERYEVWHDEENAKLLKQFDTGLCGGVPFLYNTASEEWICGAVEIDRVLAFAQKDAPAQPGRP